MTKIFEDKHISFAKRSYFIYREFTLMIKRRIESISEKEVKDLDRDLLVSLIRTVENMQDYMYISRRNETLPLIFDLRVDKKNFEALELFVYKTLLFSPIFEKKLRGKFSLLNVFYKF